jgi:hypothetical protein
MLNAETGRDDRPESIVTSPVYRSPRDAATMPATWLALETVVNRRPPRVLLIDAAYQ